MLSHKSFLPLSVLALLSSSLPVAVDGAAGATRRLTTDQERCSEELELSIKCYGACNIPESPTELNYEIELQSKTDKTWDLRQVIIQAGSTTKPFNILTLPSNPQARPNDPIDLSWSIGSDDLIGDAGQEPVLQAIVTAFSTTGGLLCNLDTNTINVLPEQPIMRSMSRDSDEDDNKPETIPAPQPVNFSIRSTKRMHLFWNYQIASGVDRHPSEAEYGALLLETDLWMTGEIDRVFGSEKRALQDVSLDIATAEYRGSERHTQQIRFAVDITWGANSLTDIPSGVDYIQKFLGSFDTTGYKAILLSNLPDGNVFKNTVSINGSLGP